MWGCEVPVLGESPRKHPVAAWVKAFVPPLFTASQADFQQPAVLMHSLPNTQPLPSTHQGTHPLLCLGSQFSWNVVLVPRESPNRSHLQPPVVSLCDLPWSPKISQRPRTGVGPASPVLVLQQIPVIIRKWEGPFE